MHFIEIPLEGAYLIDLDKKGDDRGFFARFFCSKEFQQMGLISHFTQVNNSFSQHEGTLRGLHYQLAPKAEVKLVRCIKGALYDVIVDLRPGSATFGQSFGCELTAENRLMMYVPQGFAHAFITLQNDSEVLYLVSEFYSPTHERGIRWDDPYFNIAWPIQPKVISDKDRNHPYFNPAYHLKIELAEAY